MRQDAGNKPPEALTSLLLGGGLAMLPALALAAMPQPKGFRDWMAGCDNLKSCTALSVPADAVNTIAYLRLERPAGSDGATKLVLRLSGEWQKPPLAVELKLDGAAFPAGRKSMSVTTDGDLATVTFQPAEITALIEAARKAAKLSVTAPGLSGEVSLSAAVCATLNTLPGASTTSSSSAARATAVASLPPARRHQRKKPPRGISQGSTPSA